MALFQMPIETERPNLPSDSRRAALPPDARRLAAATGDRLCCRAPPHIGGSTRFTVADEDDRAGGRKPFDGAAGAASWGIALSEGRGFRYLIAPAPARIRADNEVNPEWVRVKPGAMGAI
jgi:hypothetical protein